MQEYTTSDGRVWPIPALLSEASQRALDLLAAWAQTACDGAQNTPDPWNAAIFWLAASNVTRQISHKDPHPCIDSSPAADDILSAMAWDLYRGVESSNHVNSTNQAPKWT